jgi:hypothetical protein
MQYNLAAATILTRKASMKRRMLPDFGEDGSRERMVLLATICAEPAAIYSGLKSHYVTRCSRQRGIDQGIRMSGKRKYHWHNW